MSNEGTDIIGCLACDSSWTPFSVALLMEHDIGLDDSADTVSHNNK